MSNQVFGIRWVEKDVEKTTIVAGKPQKTTVTEKTLQFLSSNGYWLDVPTVKLQGEAKA